MIKFKIQRQYDFLSSKTREKEKVVSCLIKGGDADKLISILI